MQLPLWYFKSPFSTKPATAKNKLAALAFVSAGICLMNVAAVNAQDYYPDCASASSDADGDGYGWENNRSCRVANAGANTIDYPVCQSSNSDSDQDGYGWENNRSCRVAKLFADDQAQNTNPEGYPVCQSSKTDTDNDGYGFENNRSCIVNRTVASGGFAVCRSSSSDPDGDGYGWENNASCEVAAGGNSTSGNSTSGAASTKTPATVPTTQAALKGSVSVNDITDVVLVTGQSNVLASNTGYNGNLDQPHDRVFAFTDSGWQVADLYQSWDRFQHPGNHAGVNGTTPNNSFVFHFGKSLANRDASRVVAFIVVPDPGKGISNWDRGTQQYQRIAAKVNRALAAIPHKYALDAVLWHQGENDWLYEGTTDANPTGISSKNSYEYKNYYQIKLNSLISNVRSESWGTGQTAFICGETRRAKGVNRRLMELNSDSDPLTACVPATDLPKRADDPYGSHFSAAGLRTLGQRYADAYLKMR